MLFLRRLETLWGDAHSTPHFQSQRARVPMPTMSAVRIHAMILRYLYLLRGSWPRILELAYWPTVQMILWGFITQFFMGHSEWVAQAAGVLIAAVLLWDVLFRAQLGVTLPFYEEMYSRNLGHLFVSPLRPWELVIALLGISLVRTLIGVATAALLAIPLYHYSIFEMGFPCWPSSPSCW
jgi:ABC-2 type transport system permease protein